MAYGNRIVMETSLGDAVASRDKTNEPWEVNYPWGGDRYYGTKGQVERMMKRSIEENDNEEDES